MDSVDISVLRLKEIKKDKIFLTREEIMKFANISSGTYNDWIENLRNAIKYEIYNAYVLLEPGKKDLVMFRPFIHFLKYYNAIKDPKMIKHVPKYCDDDDADIEKLLKGVY